jgi:hypothetical protein
MKTIDGLLLRGVRILIDLVADSLQKIAQGRGSSKAGTHIKDFHFTLLNRAGFVGVIEILFYLGVHLTILPS